MSNSTKAGVEETLCGLMVRGDVIDTRLMIWWTGIALRAVDLNKLNVLFSVFTEGPDEASASRPGGNSPMHDTLHFCVLKITTIN